MGKYHVKVWSGSMTARLTDMTNAGKRGKTCRVVSIRNADASILDKLCATPEQVAARAGQEAWCLETGPVNEVRDGDMGVLVESLRLTAKADVTIEEEAIKGINAPVESLVAGVPGLWYAGADEHGISMGALDDVNEWREITHNQTYSEAYRLAAKVWSVVIWCKTLAEARDVLRNAGCKLHGYCGMD